MNQDVRKMLESMYDLLNQKFNDSVKAWDSLIEFLAVDNCGSLYYQLNHKFEWLFEDNDFARRLMKTYDFELLKSDYYDHLGEMYLERIVGQNEVRRKGLYLTPMNIAETMAVMTISSTDEKIRVLDPAVGSGRLLMAAYKKAPNSILFGVDIDLRVLRIAFTNFAIHNISGYLLHANSLEHEIDISTENGMYNWQFVNSWYSHMDKLKEIQAGSTFYNKSNSINRKQVNLF